MSRNDLTGKVVLILGGRKNLAIRLNQHFMVQDARIVIQYDSDSTDTEIKQDMAALSAFGAEVLVLQYDLADPSNITRLFKETIDRFGPIDIAIDIDAGEEQEKTW